MSPSIKSAIKTLFLLWACLAIIALSAYSCVNYGLIQTLDRDYLEERRNEP